MTQQSEPHSELSGALQDVRRYFGYTGLFSAAINLLMLVPIVYMLQVYDRVISSGSYSTLTMLTLLMVVMLTAMGIFEWARSAIMLAASNRIEMNLRDRISEATFRNALLSGGMNASAQPMTDLSALRNYLTSQAPIAFFDTPWVPIYLGMMFLFHPWFGVAATLAAIVMLGLTFLSEWLTNDKNQEANGKSAAVSAQISSNLRNAEVIAAMGMSANIDARHQGAKQEVTKIQTLAIRTANVIRSGSKSFRVIMQSLVLGLGAYLALQQEVSPGMMIGGALLLGRALAPIDQLVGSWRGFSEARAQYDRLENLLEKVPPLPEVMPLPDPVGKLTVEALVVVPPKAEIPAVRNVNLDLEPGEALGIVGPSASGKSTLARALLGIWPVFNGNVRLDGANIAQWDREALGPHIGYLPQDIELFDGTIAENISRFGELDAEKVVEAAKLAGVHELVLQLPEGYDTRIGSMGGALSGGQRQRVALARAVYNNPRLVVLDEPNSNLDDQGEKALINTVLQLKQNKSTVIVISHRVAILHVMDKMLILNEGQTVEFGPKEKVLATLTAPRDARQNTPGGQTAGN
jgi:ATP-binding cassette subfamily C protein EexD